MEGGQSGSIFISDFPCRVRQLCVHMELERQVGKQAKEEVAGAQGRKETLVKLAHFNRKHSNLLLITTGPSCLCLHPPRRRGGQQQGQVLPPRLSDNNLEKYHFLSVRSDSTHGHRLRFIIKGEHTMNV